MIRRFALLSVSLCVLWTAVPSQSAVVTLSPTADTRILDFFPSSNFANGSIVSVYTIPGNIQRTLMKFDLSGIPVDQQIVSASLTLTARTGDGTNGGGLSMDVHAVTTPWIENQATWNSASTGNPWTTAGGDFNPFIYASSNANPLNNTPVTWDVTNLVRDWYDGTIPNEGLLLRSFIVNAFIGNGLTFFSSSGINPAEIRPNLVVEFSPIPEASSLLMLGVGFVMLVGSTLFRRAMPSR